MKLPFGPWRPDEPSLGSSGVPVAQNVIPETKGFGPFPGLGDIQGSGVLGTARLVRDFRDNTGTVFVFCATNDDIYRLNSQTGLFESIGRVAGYSTPEDGGWDLLQWGDRIFASNAYDELQYYDMGVSTKFADISTVEPLSAGYSPRRMAVIRNFLFGAPMYENLELLNYRVRWSAFLNPNLWQPNPRVTQADSRDIPDLGSVKGVTGGEFGVILCEKGIIRVEYVGGRAIFQLDEVEGAPGCVETNSIIKVKGTTYWLSEDGFKAFNGQRVFDIGVGKFDDWMERSLDTSSISQMSVAKTSKQHLICWGFKSSLFTARNIQHNGPNTILNYNYELNEASYALVDHDVVGYAASPGTLLDDIDDFVDNITTPVDSPFWTGGLRYIAAMYDGSLYGFNGNALTAFIVPSEVVGENGALEIHNVEPLVEGDAVVSATIGTSKKPNQASPVWGPVRTQQPNGNIPCRDQGRYVRIGVTIDGNNWFRAFGVRVNEDESR